MIGGRVPPVENVSEYVAPGGTPWQDDRCIDWMLDAEPIRAEVGPLLLTEIDRRVDDNLCFDKHEANGRLEVRRQLMETACTALSVELDAAYQVVASLVAERDMLAGMLRETNVRHAGELIVVHRKSMGFEPLLQRLGTLVTGFRAVTLVLEDIAQAGILYDQEWLAVARKAVAAARQLAGAR